MSLIFFLRLDIYFTVEVTSITAVLYLRSAVSTNLSAPLSKSRVSCFLLCHYFTTKSCNSSDILLCDNLILCQNLRHFTFHYGSINMTNMGNNVLSGQHKLTTLLIHSLDSKCFLYVSENSEFNRSFLVLYYGYYKFPHFNLIFMDLRIDINLFFVSITLLQRIVKDLEIEE